MQRVWNSDVREPVFIWYGKSACLSELLVQTEKTQNKGTAEESSRMRHLDERNHPCSGKHRNACVHTPKQGARQALTGMLS